MLCNAAETANFISNRLVPPIKRERKPNAPEATLAMHVQNGKKI